MDDFLFWKFWADVSGIVWICSVVFLMGVMIYGLWSTRR